MKSAKYLALFLLLGIAFPVLIWVAAIVAIRTAIAGWIGSKLASASACRLDSDCPSGYVCIGGKCVVED